ncbi:hypothetical protein D5086_001323 [Populus alba]|uniref:Uncharacterized protein n=1 Tax=Populus alba TaxID=43335 RepID=A0ACC4CYU6_POPAL
MFRPPLPYSILKKYRIMPSKHSPMLTSTSTRYHLSWLHTAIFLVISTIFYTTMVSCSRIDIPYNKHCAWIAQNQPTPNDVPQFTTIPFAPNQDGYFLGGEEILDHPSSSQYFNPQ